MKAHFPLINPAQTACLLVWLLLSSGFFGQVSVRAQCLTDQTYPSPGLYSFTLPAGGPFQIRATVRGADGGVSGGSGATAGSTFAVQSGDQLTIMVGEVGRTDRPGVDGTSGGGGGTAIILTRNGTPSLLVAAGGGGGANASFNLFGGGGQGVGPSTGGAGGEREADGGGGGGGGLGGAGSAGQGDGNRIGGGGGQASLTAISPGGSSFGAGAPGGAGFGGGGGGSGTSNGGGGGGGGYGGGRGGDARFGSNTSAQGGYSFVSPAGSATVITQGVQQGSQERSGLVTIEFPNKPAPVAITQQPASGSTVCAGAAVTAQVSTSGSVTGYQWYKGGALVSGQTSATLTLPTTTTASTGNYQVVVTGCNSGVPTSVTSTAFALWINPLPIPFTVTGGGSYCAGGTGATVGLSGSQPGVSYQLLRAGNPVGNPVGGTRNALSFGNQTTVGTYTVRATTTSTACAQTMNGEATVTTTAQPSVSLGNDGPLTCAKTQVTLTASSATSGTFVFGGPGVSQSGTANTATVSQEGLYSVTLTVAGGCSASATTTVGSNTSLAAPNLTASATQTSGQPISVTASGCSGTLNWLPQGGSGQANGAIYTFTQPGNYTLSATCSVGTCTSPASAPVALQIRPGGLAITSVNMVSCQLFDAAKGEYQVRFTPQYSGSNGQPITFAVVNELAPTSQPAPYQLRLYDDNPTITLVANQPANNQARFAYEWLASCRSGGQPNQPPTTSGIPNQSIRQDQPYQLSLTDYFADPDAQPLTFSASGLPAGLSLSGSLISGRPSGTGVSTVNITALDPGGLQVSTRFSLTVTPRPTTPSGFTITGVSLVSCEPAGPNRRQLRFTPQYAGTDATPISFSVTNELSPTTTAGPYTLLLYTDNPLITLSARQGSAQASFRYNWLQACSAGARVGAESGASLRAVVLGNPASGSQVNVEVRGAEGQPLRVQLTDASGRAVSERLIERAGAVERLSLPSPSSPAGLLLLRISTPTQSRVVKVMRID